MTWVRLRLPGLSRTVEFLCLLPLTIPAIVLVVGLTPVYALGAPYFFGGNVRRLAGLRLRRPGAPLRLPRPRRRAAGDRRPHPVRGGARSLGRELDHGDVPGRSCPTSARPCSPRRSSRSPWRSASSPSPTCSAAPTCRSRCTCIGKSDSQISVAVGLASLVFAFVILFAMSFVGGARSATSPLARLRRPARSSHDSHPRDRRPDRADDPRRGGRRADRPAPQLRRRCSALDGLDPRLAPGELVALLGPSGCGKTTALRLPGRPGGRRRRVGSTSAART